MRFNLYRLAIVAASLAAASSAWANHPVLVEGNCDSPVPGTTIVGLAGTCGDFDGDGRIGTAEDTDGADRIFGTINAALGPGIGASAGTGANQNGTVTIVTSGRFAEQVLITAANGNVTLQAAPGVEAQIDAVLQADPAGGNTARLAQTGIVIQAPAGAHHVILKNLTVRNWTVGIAVQSSQVAVIDVRVANNQKFGIRVVGTSKVSIDQSQVLGTGFRTGSGVVGTSSPGDGISYEGTSFGAIFRTEVSGSVGAGIVDQSTRTIQIQDVYLFANAPNQVGF